MDTSLKLHIQSALSPEKEFTLLVRVGLTKYMGAVVREKILMLATNRRISLDSILTMGGGRLMYYVQILSHDRTWLPKLRDTTAI
jgi:hypothetical protein